VKILAKLVLLAWVGVCANAQTADNAEIRNLAVVQEKGGVKIEVELTSPITPEVTVVNPEQLVLELPGAVSEQRAPIRVIQKEGRSSGFSCLRPLDRTPPSQESSTRHRNHSFFPECSCATAGPPPNCDAKAANRRIG
jgi:hypothetical protein